MVREIKQQIRTLVRKSLKIPEFTPIRGCDLLSKDCETETVKHFIESSKKTSVKEKLEVRSIEIDPRKLPDEPDYCSIGPEFHEEMKNISGFEKEIRGDVSRRQMVMYVYSAAIIITLILTLIIFSNNSQIPDSIIPIHNNFGLLVAGLVLPIIAASYIHLNVAQRVRTDALMYWLPAFIVLSLLGTWWMSSADKDGFARVFAVIGVVGVIASTIGISVKHITMFNECHAYQSLLKMPPRETSVGFFVSVAVILLLSFINGWIISSV